MAALNYDILNNYGSTETHSLSNLLNDPESTESIGPLVQDSPYIDCESLEQFFTPLIDTFSVMSLNAQSLNAKYDSLRTLFSPSVLYACRKHGYNLGGLLFTVHSRV